MALNTIKVKQIDNDELLAFLQSSLGLAISGSKNIHTFQQDYNSNVAISGTFTASGNSQFKSSVTLDNGFTSNSGIFVNGNISGQSITIDNFSIPSATIASATFGGVIFTGISIYEAAQASQAVLLSSGTIFGIRQTINAPPLEKDSSGNFMPTTGLGTSVIMLCMSIGA